MNLRILNNALHNSGYRYLGEKEGVHIYVKPIGYGCLCAKVRNVDAGMILEIFLTVKGKPQKDGTRPNLRWESCCVEFLISSCKEEYLLGVEAIRNSEVDIFDTTPVSWVMNRDVRYDFEENPALELDLI